jgi:hypothetical protein
VTDDVIALAVRDGGGLTTVDEFAAFERRGSSAIRGVGGFANCSFCRVWMPRLPVFKNEKSDGDRLTRPVGSL